MTTVRGADAQPARADADPSERDGDDAPLGLRERRRRQTERDIGDAALDLFERKGVAHTTVDEIARAAGVSPRTFFRHCPAKEHAVLLDDEGIEDELLAAIAALGPGDHVLSALEDRWEAIMLRLESDERPHEHALRIRRLMRAEPTLLAAGLRVDDERNERCVAAIVSHTELDELHARAVTVSLSSVARLALDEWIARAERGEPAPLVELLREGRAALRDVARR